MAILHWQIDLDAALGLAEISFSGVIRLVDVLDAYAALQAHPDFRPDLAILADYSGSIGYLSAEEVRNLASRKSIFDRTPKRAVVVGSEFGFGMARMFELIKDRGSTELGVFRDADEARRWLLNRERL